MTRSELTDLPPIYQEASGIWRVRASLETTFVPSELAPEPRPVAATTVPTFFDQLFSYTEAAELIELIVEPELAGYLGGMSNVDYNDVITILSTIPLEPAMRLSSWIQRRLRLHPTDQAKQLETMEMLYGPRFRAAGEIMLRAYPRRSLFSEQQAFAFQRLLLLHAEDRPADDVTPDERALLLWAHLWIPDAVLDPDLGADRTLIGWELADERFLRFFVSNGGLAGHAAFKHELARAYTLYHVIANSRAARRRHDHCPLDEWLEERYGLDFTELQTFGFSFFARSNVGDRGDGALLFTHKEYFDNTGLAAHYDRALDAIAAPREWFVEQFAESKEQERRAAYEFQPFLRRPALLQRDGNAVVLGLRAIEGWLSSTGAYYRFFDLAKSRGVAEMERFRSFNGWLQETYIRRLTHIAHPHPKRRVLSGSARVYGEQPYKVKGRGTLMTSDIAVDLGIDIVLVEVTTKRVTQKSVEGELEAVIADMRALVIKKMNQLARVVDDLAAGRATLPDVSFEFVKRVFPIVVSPDGLFHTPTLWAWLQEESKGCLSRAPGLSPSIAPLILLDAEEYEVLMGLVADGASLVSLLELKTTPLWRERDFKAMHLDQFGPEAGQLPFIDQEVARSFRHMVKVLRNPTPEPLPFPNHLAA